MRRFVSLFILSMFLFLILCSSIPSSNSTDRYGNDFSTLNIYYTSDSNNDLLQGNEDGIDHYTAYEELGQILKQYQHKYNNIMKLYDNLGSTYEDRIIWMLKISDNPKENEDDETEVLFVGAHHGNEAIGNEMALLIIKTLLEGYRNDPRITWLVDNHEIWIVPMPNPDGLTYTLTQESWRKNRSPNYISEVTPGPLDPKLVRTSYGTDLNRNYDYEWGDPEGSSVLLQRSGTYAGSEPFSELETQALRDLTLAHNFSAYMDYHSGIELILYPWGFSPDPTPHNAIYERVGEKFSEMTGYEAIQGYELYQSNGDAVDWVYSASEALSFTIELSSPKMPDPTTIQPILDDHLEQPLYLTGISSSLDQGSQINIIHESIKNQTDKGPITITAIINGIPQLTELKVELYYRDAGKEFKIIKMQKSNDNPKIYSAEIPTQGPDKWMEYYISVNGEGIMVCSPSISSINEFYVNPSPESYIADHEIVAMVIMMIIIMGFFWGGFAFAARKAMVAEQRKLHEYYYEENPLALGRVEKDIGY